MKQWLMAGIMCLALNNGWAQDLRPRDQDILDLLLQYFGKTPSSSAIMEARMGTITESQFSTRAFAIRQDTLIIRFYDPKELVTGLPFRDTFMIPFKLIEKTTILKDKIGDEYPGLAIQFIPKKTKNGTKPPEDIAASGNSKISSKQIEETKSGTIGQRMVGRAAGVQVVNDNNPGGGMAVRIRGINSINSGNSPLYLVDDVPISNINTINPDDIASIEILKDAGATAMYGVRGANGVIKITTKKGGGEGEIPEELASGQQPSFLLWVFGEKARQMRKNKDDKRLTDLIQARIQ
jgi:TonB-dependent SusC/RagA subfamily outer membrane receptor